MLDVVALYAVPGAVLESLIKRPDSTPARGAVVQLAALMRATDVEESISLHATIMHSVHVGGAGKGAEQLFLASACPGGGAAPVGRAAVGAR